MGGPCTRAIGSQVMLHCRAHFAIVLLARLVELTNLGSRSRVLCVVIVARVSTLPEHRTLGLRWAACGQVPKIRNPMIPSRSTPRQGGVGGDQMLRHCSRACSPTPGSPTGAPTLLQRLPTATPLSGRTPRKDSTSTLIILPGQFSEYCSCIGRQPRLPNSAIS